MPVVIFMDQLGMAAHNWGNIGAILYYPIMFLALIGTIKFSESAIRENWFEGW
jgi:hypothetical protein